MDKKKLRTLNLCLYGGAIVISLIALYTFGFIKNLENKDK